MCTLTDESCVVGGEGGGGVVVQRQYCRSQWKADITFNICIQCETFTVCTKVECDIGVHLYHVVKLIPLMVEHSGSVFLRNVDIAYIVYIICERSITGSKSNASQMHTLYFLEPWFQL